MSPKLNGLGNALLTILSLPDLNRNFVIKPIFLYMLAHVSKGYRKTSVPNCFMLQTPVLPAVVAPVECKISIFLCLQETRQWL